jgi:PAS domain S-box-containing protein
VEGADDDRGALAGGPAGAPAPSEERLRQTLDHLLEGCMILGRDWRYVYLNETIARQGLTTRAACEGRTLLDVYPGVEHSDAFAAYRRCMEERTPQRYEGPFRFPDGTTRWFELSAQPVPEGIFVLSIDRTEAHEAELARRAAAERDRLLFTESADGIYLGTADGTLLQVNPAFCAMLGQPAERLLGRRISEFYAPTDDVAPRVPPPGETLTSERRVVTGDGREIVLVSRLRALPDGAVLGAARDLTREREEQARAADARRREAVGRLAGGVAHNLNNALAAINGTAELLAATCDPDDPRQDDLAAILAAGQSAAALARELLAFGRRQALRPAPFDLGEALSVLAPTLRHTLGEARPVTLVLGAEPCRVVADRARVEEALLDLAIHARDAMPSGGSLVVTLARAEADDAVVRAHPHVRPGPYARLELRDAGSGLAPEVVAHVFDPFFTTTGAGLGRGLGLATVAGTIEQSGGWATVTSTLGRGTTFALHLPIAAAIAPVERPHLGERAAPASGVILLVEDEPAVRRVTARALEHLGYSVLALDDPRAALAFDDDTLARVDLLVTDVVMPAVDGPELARRLRARRPDLPTLFVSGFAPDALVRDRLLDPGVRLLAKPFTRLELAAAVRGALGRD